MSVLSANDVSSVQHYAPLHYLPFIARSRAILSKPSLGAAGFKSTHLRSMSHGQDVARGFGSYAHMTLDAQPRILRAKLGAGFPHFALSVPVASIEANKFSLCRYNVAMTRRLKRGKSRGFSESKTNGRYYLGHQIPIARDKEDMMAMLAEHLPLGTMIEVLAAARRITQRRRSAVRLARDIPELKLYVGDKSPYRGSIVAHLETAYREGQSLLLEGTQGSGLSIFHGP